MSGVFSGHGLVTKLNILKKQNKQTSIRFCKQTNKKQQQQKTNLGLI